MKERIRQLARLCQLREARERMTEVSCLRAQRDLEQVMTALAELKDARVLVTQEGRVGLLGGEWEQWWLAETTGLLTEQAEAEMRLLQESRQQTLERAQGLLTLARQEAEQVRILEKQAVDAARLALERTEQAGSDDRFAARAHWVQRTNAQRQATEMNLP